MQVCPLQAGHAEMDSTQFAKLCRDAGLLDRTLTATAADLVFVARAQQQVLGSFPEPGALLASPTAWVCSCSARSTQCCPQGLCASLSVNLFRAAQGSRKLSFRQFVAALEQLAQEKGVPSGVRLRSAAAEPPCR